MAQGQKAENLLDFDDDEPISMSSTSLSFSNTPANLSGSAPAAPGKTVKNPMDELMDLFAGSALSPAPTGESSTGVSLSGNGLGSSNALSGLGAFGMGDPSPTVGTSPMPASTPSPAPPSAPAQKKDAFSGLDDFGFGSGSGTPTKTATPPPATTTNGQNSMNDDLLGLF